MPACQVEHEVHHQLVWLRAILHAHRTRRSKQRYASGFIVNCFTRCKLRMEVSRCWETVRLRYMNTVC